LTKSKLEFKNFKKSVRRPVWNTVREDSVLAGHFDANANCSHWNIYAECELSRFSQAVNGHSARIPETNENFERASKIQTGL
jgi:hypothetical protein